MEYYYGILLRNNLLLNVIENAGSTNENEKNELRDMR